MDVKTLAWCLLLGQIASVGLILMVIIRQLRLFKARVPRDIVWFRRILFSLALTIFVGNAIPLMVDVVTVLGLIRRSTGQINATGVAYTASNTLTAFFSALLIWILYRMAARTLLATERDRRVALEKADNR